MKAIRDKEFPGFILHASQERKSYLANLLDSTMVICALTIDPKASRLVDQRISNFILYADTNFFIFLLGLSDPTTKAHVKRLVELTIEAGVRIIVSQYTLNELREVIVKNRDFIINNPSKARIEAKDRLSKGRYNLITAYVLRCEELGVALSPHDFYNPFIFDLETRLSSYGIIIENKETAYSPNGSILETETEFLLKNTEHYGDRVGLARHDAYHKLLIDYLRGENPVFGGIAQHWFLTCDYRLPKYALQRASSLNIPFCILSSAWLVFLRTLHPRTSDFAQATSELLFQPALGLYDDIASELLKITRAKYKHISEFSLEVQAALPITRLLENVIDSTQKEQGDIGEYEYDRAWVDEIAEPAAAGSLTEDLRYKEAIILQNQEIKKQIESLSVDNCALSTKAKNLEKIVIALVVWALMIATSALFHMFFQTPVFFFFFSIIICSLVPFIFIVQWKTLTSNIALCVVLVIILIACLAALLILPSDIVWKTFLGLATIAGFVRASGQIIRWLKE